MSFPLSTTVNSITNALVSIGLKTGVQLRVTTTLIRCGGNVVSNIANLIIHAQSNYPNI